MEVGLACVCCLNLTLTTSEQNLMLYKARGHQKVYLCIFRVSYLNWAFSRFPFVQLPAGWSPRAEQGYQALLLVNVTPALSDTDEKEISLCNVHAA